ncbi:related to regulatory protein involved in control of sterol uptake [Phialocephala subalpina]|uniref:Related to regulatory protein involved in control of sterol uptake n=1 Tax=Phialocephala subalpina TaxID=576137 RepID=A0A1L7WLJ5_9HELO|nr:related to regulatory protein involved in control of sterol uptake [Phialocephala subalpina]
MTGEFITKRPHKKSRGGCHTCKTKKVKCDELQPKCGFCHKRNLTCVYPPKTTRSAPPSVSGSQSGEYWTEGLSPQTDLGPGDSEPSWELVQSPPPLVMSSAGALSAIDIRMMHQWSSMTSTQIAIGDGAHKTLQITIPELAFENEYLMNGILGIASLHVQTLVPHAEQARRQTDLYRAKALSLFRQALPGIVPFTRNYEAALVMSILLVVLCSRDHPLPEGELAVVNWFILYRGLSTVIQMASFPRVSGMSVSPIFKREMSALKVTPVVPTVLMDLVRAIPVDDPDFDMLEDYCKILDAIAMLYASLQQDGIGDGLFIRVVAWPSFSSHGFSKCASEYRPRALIILSYYLMFVKLVDLWWMDGIGDRDIEGVSKRIHPRWLPFMAVPLQVMRMTDRDEIAKLMLG